MLDPNRFVQEKQKHWKELERELDVISSGAFQTFSIERARRLGQLYRMASSDLIRARTETANEAMTDYLNGLVGRAYSHIYRGRKTRWNALWVFLAFTFPARVRHYWRWVLASALVFFAGALFGLFAEYFDSSAKHYMLPPQYAAVEENIEAFKAKAAQGQNVGGGLGSVQSTAIMTNNIQVSFLAFALGSTLGIGTVAVLFHNGVLLGVLTAVFLRHSLSLYFWAYILPHGVIELMAIYIAGAAGFLIAKAIVAPGLYGRRRALQHYGREAVLLVVGCSFMLIVAGLIEGFVTPQGFIPHGIKLLFAFMTFLGLVAYFGFNEALLAGLGFHPPSQRYDPMNALR